VRQQRQQQQQQQQQQMTSLESSSCMEVEQDCPLHGCWWQKRDIARRVLSFLPSNVDVLTCDMVCVEWHRLKVKC
jgi:hypothetical protein